VVDLRIPEVCRGTEGEGAHRPGIPPANTIPRVLHKPDGEMRGYCEPMVALDAGKVVQFKRIGFIRIEKVTARIIEPYWGHR